MAHASIEGGSTGASDAVPAWRKTSKRALKLFGAGFVALVVGFAVALLVKPQVGAIVLWIGSVLFLLGFGWSIAAIVRLVKASDPGRAAMATAVVALPMLAGAFFSLFGSVVAFAATIGFARGRQLRQRGKVLLPPLTEGDSWSRVGMRLPAAPDGVAERWRENGRTEHASVAAFARLTLDLIALGAPPSLIEAANRDAMDEIRHADLCFSIARAFDGRDEAPGPFPAAQHAGGLPRPRTLALAQLAVSSLIDGALHEGVSARVIARLARQCEDGPVRDALRELAADEGRHAAHGWDVVEWCIAQGGAPVASALRGALQTIPERMATDVGEPGWERYGLHGAALETEEYARARADVAGKVLRA